MKFLHYKIIGICILTFSCSHNTITITENEIPEDVFYLINRMTPFSGKCLIYYTNTKVIKEELHFRRGVQDGPHISYYNNGEIKRKGKYRAGLMDGTWIMFNEKGNKLYEVNYQNDTLAGTYRSWYPTGVPCKKGSYFQNKRTGEWIHYDEAGMVKKTERL